MSNQNSSSAKKLGTTIKTARKELGMSQREFAQALDISDKTVSSYEVGRATPSFDMLRDISRIVNKPLAYFDSESHSDDIDLEIKLNIIERELLEIKQLLKKRT